MAQHVANNVKWLSDIAYCLKGVLSVLISIII